MWIAVDKCFQGKQEAPEEIGGQTEELEQPMADNQAEATAKFKPRVENVWQGSIFEATNEGKVKGWIAEGGEAEKRAAEEATVAKLKAQAEEALRKMEAEAEKRAAEEATVAELKAQAGEARCKAEALEREAMAARAQAKRAKMAANQAVAAAAKSAKSAKSR